MFSRNTTPTPASYTSPLHPYKKAGYKEQRDDYYGIISFLTGTIFGIVITVILYQF